MPRKKRPNPQEEGSIKKIKKLFFKPLFKWRPENMSVKEWLEEIFHLHKREIFRCKATKDFNMLGSFLEAPLRPIPGTQNRRIKQGTQMFVRIDDTMPDKVHVEVLAGTKDRVFELAADEWRSTERFIEKL